MVLVIALTAGCNSAVLGNLTMLAISIGIFIGTLSLRGQVAKSASRGHYSDPISKQLSQQPATDEEPEPNG
jgi:hypothetical protein